MAYIMSYKERKALNDRLFKALEERRPIEEIEAIIKESADVNARDEYRRTPLMWAGTPEQTELLIKWGADFDAEDRFGMTALMYAESVGQTEYLIDAGADVNATNTDGGTALMCARNEKQTKALIDAGANVYAEDRFGMTALDHALTNEQKTVLLEAMRASAKTTVKEHIEQRKQQILKSRQLRKAIEEDEGKLSGTVIADKIAEDVISGKEKRTITPEVGAELRRRKAAQK